MPLNKYNNQELGLKFKPSLRDNQPSKKKQLDPGRNNDRGN